MRHFFEWFAKHGEAERTWLILGKGPSFALRRSMDLSSYRLLSLNHAVREQPVQLAHMIDLDVVDSCGEALLHQADYLVLPWYPHVRNAPGQRSLEHLVPGHALLRRLAQEGRLFWYDLSTASRRHGPGPVVQATYFSAEAAVSLLALAGVRRVRSLGVDGGASYSTEFDDLTGRTLLANSRTGFDLQFQGIARTMLRTGVDFAPLDLPSPIVACVPSSQASALPERVLEFSLRRRTSISLRLLPIQSAADGGQVATALAGVSEAATAGSYRRAVVLHPGALVLDDLRRLWSRPPEREGVEVPRGTGPAAAPGPPAVALVTAADARELGAMCLALLRPTGPEPAVPTAATLSESWDHRDRFVEGQTSLLRYQEPGLQPWISRAHPLGHLWVAALLEAVREGFVTLDLIRREVQLGHVRPSLLEQVERDNPESLLVSRSARQRDAAFSPPGELPATAGGPLLLLRALAREARRRAGIYRRRRAATLP